MKNSIIITGTVVTKATAPGYLLRMCRFADRRTEYMEASNMIFDIECQLVKAGFLTWQQTEEIEIAALG